MMDTLKFDIRDIWAAVMRGPDTIRWAPERTTPVEFRETEKERKNVYIRHGSRSVDGAFIIQPQWSIAIDRCKR